MKYCLSIAMLLLAGCAMPTLTTSNESRDIISKYSYVRDDRTGLCFALLTYQQYGAEKGISTTYVPCEPSVLRLIR